MHSSLIEQQNLLVWLFIFLWMAYLAFRIANPEVGIRADAGFLDHNYRRALRLLKTVSVEELLRCNNELIQMTTDSRRAVKPVLIRISVPPVCGRDISLLSKLVLPPGCRILGVARNGQILHLADCSYFHREDTVLAVASSSTRASMIEAILNDYLNSNSVR